MPDADFSHADRLTRPTVRERRELDELVETFRRTSPTGSRRDLFRWSAAAAGALATARLGVAGAAPSDGSRGLVRFQDAEIEQDATVTIPLDPYGQAVTLDPHRAVNWGAFWVMFPNVWGGLVRYDENAKVQLDLAESYTVSDDGTIYQFKIRPDARYANGNEVKAGDFVASWQRALDPSRGIHQPLALGIVAGAGAGVEVAAGEEEHDHGKGDRFRDLAIGAYFQDTPGHTDAGKAFLFLGSAFGISKKPAWTSSGDDLIDGKYATSVTALGDLNQDGYEDLLIGSKQKENDQIQSGKIFLYRGDPKGFGKKAAWTDAGENQQQALFGEAAAALYEALGFTVEQHPVPMALLGVLDEPLLSSTMILPAHGVALNDAGEIRRHLEHFVDLVIDSGPCDGQMTTVIDLSGDAPRLVREGRGDTRPFGFVKAALH